MKPLLAFFQNNFKRVAPPAGAWIETAICSSVRPNLASPPLRGRGLKLYSLRVDRLTPKSPPLRGRGLKR